MDIILTIDLLTPGHLNAGLLRPLHSQAAHEPVAGAASIDVVARVEQAHTVADLAAALGRYLGLRGGQLLRPGPAAFSVIDPRASLSDIGLGSGERLGIADAAAIGDLRQPSGRRSNDDADTATALVVTSGPDVGRSVNVSSAPLEIGRDRSCGLSLCDPRVSRRHLVVAAANQPASLAGQQAAMIEPSDEARHPVGLNGHTINGPSVVVEGDLIRVGGTTLTITSSLKGAWCGARPPSGGWLGGAPFHRTPYYSSPVQDRVFDPMGVIPDRPEPPRFAYLAALAPLLFGITMAFVYSPRMLMFAVFSPIIALAAYVESRRRTSFRFGEGLERYQRKLEERRAEIVEAFADERVRRYRCAPDLAALAERAIKRSADLWIRDRRALDYLQLRLGLGDVVPAVTIRPETRGDESLRDELEQELDAFAMIDDVPITVDLVENAVLALVGSVADTTDLASSLLIQATCLHSPEDLVLLAALDSGRGMETWMKWLPHVRSASSPFASPHLATSTEDANRLLKDVLAVVEERCGDRDRGVDQRWPRLLVVIDRNLEPDPTVVSRLLDSRQASGLSVIWLTDGADRVPRQASAVVACRPPLDPLPSALSHTDPTIDDATVEIDRITGRLAEAVARSLASVVDASSATGSSALPRLVAMQGAFATASLDAEWVLRHWGADRGYALTTPIGIADGGPFVIDLVAHGPHALIGGTSGSGKSELLMAMVAGLIAHNPPTRVNVLFVDYKGGASSDVFREAPHTVGYVTNLDGLMARRALTSLRAELNRRMNLLQGRAKDLAEMIERHPDEAPPSLVIVVDEFATLIKEVPDFVTGIVDVAQRGRSLGIHLVLATQRPSGAVNDNILANTNLRISLRMLDSIESTSVIGTNDAAMIPVPLKGRAFARVGPGEIVAFQSAWTGAPLIASEGVRPIEIDVFDPVGPGGSTGTEDAAKDSIEVTSGNGVALGSQLDALLSAVKQAAACQQLSPVRPPWHDELPVQIDLGSVLASTGPAQRGSLGWSVAVGLVDDPEAQSQYPAVVDFERGGGLVVFGTGGSGKTMALQTVAVSAAVDDADRGEGNLTIFGLDFASRELASITALPQCVEVAGGQDLEAVTRIISLLDQQLERRRNRIGEGAQPDQPAPRFAPTLLLIDDYGNLAQCFEGAGAPAAGHGWLEKLNRIVVDGRQVGMYTALTAARRASVKASLLSAISNRIVLRQAETGGYPELGVPSNLASDADLGPGRGFWDRDKLVQLAIASDVTDTAETIVAERLPGGACASAPIRALPSTLSVTDAPLLMLAPATTALPIGLADMSNEAATLDVSINNLTVVGDPQSGRSTAMATLAHQLRKAEQRVWAIGPVASPLAERQPLAESGFGSPERVVSLLERLIGELEATSSEPPPFLLVDDVDLMHDSRADALISQACSLGCRWIAATVNLRGYSTDFLPQEMKRARSFLYLQPPGIREVQEATGCLPTLRPGLKMPPGRGVLVENRRSTIVQVARL